MTSAARPCIMSPNWTLSTGRGMKRRTFVKGMAVASSVVPLLGAPAMLAEAAPRRSVREFPLPQAKETHELIQIPGSPLVLVSQMNPSQLVKVVVDATGTVTAARAFALGPADAGAHGLEVSKTHPGRVWCTLEHADQLLLLDPHPDEPDRPPTVERTIELPGGVHGPHYIGEYDDELWVTCKGTDQVLRIQHENPGKYRVYEAEPHPIFVARHDRSGVFYVSQDLSSSILRIDATTHETRHIRIPKTSGATPVGLTAGPAGVWVALLGTERKPTGTIGRLDAAGDFTWLTLRTAEARESGLLHIAFAPAANRPTAWLVSSSIINPTVRDAIIRVEFDDSFGQIVAEEITNLPTQRCMAHRVLPVAGGVLVTEMTSSKLAHLGGD